jgi:nucleoside-diphosphate-sugar epimerase
MKLQGEKILVTGGAGFVGSHLCDRFITEGAEVVCLDDLSTGFKRNIEQLMNQERFTFIQGDVRDLDSVSFDLVYRSTKHDIFEELKVDAKLKYEII